jgi:hypothetical protein
MVTIGALYYTSIIKYEDVIGQGSYIIGAIFVKV